MIKLDMFVDSDINCRTSVTVANEFFTLNTMVALFELLSFTMLITSKAKFSYGLQTVFNDPPIKTPLQLKPLSRTQLLEDPSPPIELPSSH